MRPPLVVLATRSLGKLHELRPMFARAGIRAIDLDEAGIREQPAEEGLEAYETFEENAAAKARYFHGLARLPVVADDSGLEVSALDGRPGVRSKRWSARLDLSGRALDAANNDTLLRALTGVADRRARYVCVAAYLDCDGIVLRRAEVSGRIVDVPRGHGGFGYDPYFEVDGLGRTFGESDETEKEAYSHRGRAMRALFDALGRGRVSGDTG
ncbi:MAG TPA: non-canonical purine NTP pyrophosphatase [Gemmatimonadaceae bacterium]|nr:non-canonical purine NTP pyrophosphatase [Gemmatimonadaceae bacterium]